MSDLDVTSTPDLLEESINLENNIGELYKLFAATHKEDEIFWCRLAEEEKKHAMILMGLRPWAALGVNVKKYLLPDINALRENNASIMAVIDLASKETPDRTTTFRLASRIERTISEIHFQKLMNLEVDNKLLSAMRDLCEADKDHLKRINRRMSSLDIPQSA
jgi:hypothetical protein